MDSAYHIENISKIIHRMKVNGGDYILRWYSSGISLQNTSPVEKNEDYFILTWNSGYNYFQMSRVDYDKKRE